MYIIYVWNKSECLAKWLLPEIFHLSYSYIVHTVLNHVSVYNYVLSPVFIFYLSCYKVVNDSV